MDEPQPRTGRESGRIILSAAVVTAPLPAIPAPRTPFDCATDDAETARIRCRTLTGLQTSIIVGRRSLAPWSAASGRPGANLCPPHRTFEDTL